MRGVPLRDASIIFGRDKHDLKTHAEPTSYIHINKHREKATNI